MTTYYKATIFTMDGKEFSIPFTNKKDAEAFCEKFRDKQEDEFIYIGYSIEKWVATIGNNGKVYKGKEEEEYMEF